MGREIKKRPFSRRPPQKTGDNPSPFREEIKIPEIPISTVEKPCGQIPEGQQQSLEITQALGFLYRKQGKLIIPLLDTMIIGLQNEVWRYILGQETPRADSKIPLTREELKGLESRLLLVGFGSRIHFGQGTGLIYPRTMHFLFFLVTNEPISPERYWNFRLGIAGSRKKGDGKNPFFSQYLDAYIIPEELLTAQPDNRLVTPNGTKIIGIPVPETINRAEQPISYPILAEQAIANIEELQRQANRIMRAVTTRPRAIVKPEPYFPDKEHALIRFRGDTKKKRLEAKH